nr:phosphatidylinositol N-acetylglucosaminyltransferase subunit P [Helicoverpa armigera]XP_049694997.1 phosphatidylinositol N-acetylglucosaminyltransferase subunit P [Helicoverpa armigera]
MPEHTPAPTPARSLYGFFMYLFSKTMLFIYCIWAITPDAYLHYFNIYYYPQKYWSTAIPIQCLVALTIFAFLIYPSSNLMLTANIDSINTISDPHAHYECETNENNNNTLESCICTDVNKCMKYCHVTSNEDLEENTVPQLRDLNIRLVCKKLYYSDNST